MRILVVDDESFALNSIQRLLRRQGIQDVRVCDTGEKAVSLIKEEEFDVVLLDLLLPDIDGMEVLEAAKPFKPDVEFLILTAVDDIATAVRAIRLGAFDYLVKPVENDRLLIAIERAYERRGLRAGLAGSYRGEGTFEIPEAFSSIITRSPRMMELLTYARIMARGNNPILITGESGTGKELMAKGIHLAGPAAEGPYVAVNVSAIPETLFESQIFGHIKGAFTGALSEYRGFFEQADGGTLFLDEIGELPMGHQAKLLRVIEDQTVYRIGSTQPIPVQVRIVSATNIDIDHALKEGRFRLDLMCRLKSVHIHLPPLKERIEDIPLLARHFLKQSSERYGKAVRGFTPEAVEILIRKKRPGNIRSLSQEVENAVLLTESEWIEPRHLGARPAPASLSVRGLCSLKENHYRHVAYVLGHVKGDSQAAAEILGVSIRHVQRILSQIRNDPVHRTLIGDI